MKRPTAFTLVELLVVVAIIVALLAILLPSMGRAVEIAQRAQCGSNLRQIQLGALSYATDNFGTLFKCRNTGGTTRVQIAINPYEHNGTIDWFGQLADLGLAVQDPAAPSGYEFNNVWNCPSRDFKPQWEAGYNQMVIGYQYMGGIEQWQNPFVGSMASRSPVTVSGSQGGWVLAADASGKIDSTWGGGRATAFGGMPPHRSAEGPWPEGHNQVTLDGAVRWVDGKDLVFVHSWGGWNRVYFMAQADLGGWQPPVGAYLEALK